MPSATRGNFTRPDVYGILSGEWRCLCAGRLTVATVVTRARGSRVENMSTRGRPTRHQRRPRAFEPASAAWPPLAACASARDPGGSLGCGGAVWCGGLPRGTGEDAGQDLLRDRAHRDAAVHG